MLSLQFIRDNIETVRRAVAEKAASLDVDALLALDGELRALKARVDELRRQRNAISDGFRTAPLDERPALGQRAKAIGAEIAAAEADLGERQSALDALMLRVPNIPWHGAPVGPDESANIVVRREGEIP